MVNNLERFFIVNIILECVSVEAVISAMVCAVIKMALQCLLIVELTTFKRQE